ncbi:MAG: hypothetical protein GXY83_42440 [Rhodopirellula sp.]|nr:hypothetical protein [Rhodopirellula sp.]
MTGESHFRKTTLRLILLGVSLTIGFLAADLIVRYVFFNPVCEYSGSGLKIQLSPEMLYTIVPDSRLGINSDGFRDHEFTLEKNGKKRICFLGDSFTMGLNVRPEETIPEALQTCLGEDFDVCNMGALGFGPDQSLKVLKKTGLKLMPDLVIEAVFPANDFNDLYKNGLFTLDESGQLIETKTNMVKSLIFPSASAIVNQVQFLWAKAWTVDILLPLLFNDGYDYDLLDDPNSDRSKYKVLVMGAVLNEFHLAATRQGASFLVVIIPSFNNICDDKELKQNNVDPERYFTPENLVQFLAEKHSIPVLNLTPAFMANKQRCDLWDRQDGHLSPLGTRYAAEIIAEYIQNQTR